jgi:hypothetical protein
MEKKRLLTQDSHLPDQKRKKIFALNKLSCAVASISENQVSLDSLFSYYSQFGDSAIAAADAHPTCAPSAGEMVIGPAGLFQLTRDLAVPDKEALWFVLVLSYYMEASTFGRITQNEFRNGMVKLKIESWENFKMRIEMFRIEYGRRMEEIYEYAFKVAKATPVQRVIKLDLAIKIIEALLPNMVHTNNFLEFLRNSKYNVLNGDQWRMFLLFNRVVGEDFREYSVDGAWPVLIDEFVEYVSTRTKEDRMDIG